MKRLPILLTEQQHRGLKVKAAQAGLPAAEIVRRFLLAWLAGEIELPGEAGREERMSDDVLD